MIPRIFERIRKRGGIGIILGDKKMGRNYKMDRIEEYKQIIKEILNPYIDINYPYGKFKNFPVYDDNHLSYIIISVGWEDMKRVHGCLIHLDIINEKIWIQRDGTEHGIADDLMEKGVKPEEIVLAFHEETARQYTDFAVK